MQITLNEEQIKQFDSLLGEIPAKWSVPAIMFLSQVIQEQNKNIAEFNKTGELTTKA